VTVFPTFRVADMSLPPQRSDDVSARYSGIHESSDGSFCPSVQGGGQVCTLSDHAPVGHLRLGGAVVIVSWDVGCHTNIGNGIPAGTAGDHTSRTPLSSAGRRDQITVPMRRRDKRKSTVGQFRRSHAFCRIVTFDRWRAEHDFRPCHRRSLYGGDRARAGHAAQGVCVRGGRRSGFGWGLARLTAWTVGLVNLPSNC
jgi:hypothetical protein